MTDPDKLTQEQLKRRRSRSLALAVALGVLVVLIYVVSFIKGPGIIDRPM